MGAPLTNPPLKHFWKVVMKLSELHKLTDEKAGSIMAALSLGRVRSRAAVNGFTPAPTWTAPNRAGLRAAKFHKGENSAYGHIYSQSVDPAEVKRRRAANKVARHSRAINRKRG